MTEVKTNGVEAKQQAARDALHKSFAGKLCPFLSIGNFKPTAESCIVPVGQVAPAKTNEGEALGCQGPACMMFILTAADEVGNACAGSCSLAVLPSAILQVRETMLHGAEFLGKSFKIRPRV